MTTPPARPSRTKGFFSRRDLAIDLGTWATRLHTGLRCDPISRPSVVWRHGEPTAALRAGVVVDPDAAAAVVAGLLEQVPRSPWRRPRVLACVPTDASPDERAAVAEAVRRAGASRVILTQEPLAAAVGAGVAVDDSWAHVIVDVGEGVTDLAVVRAGRIETSDAVRLGVADLRLAITSAIAKSLSLRVAAVEAERLLRCTGVLPGRARATRLHLAGAPHHGVGPVTGFAQADLLYDALDPICERIAERVGHFLRELPASLAGEVRDVGILLSGGGALLGGMAERLVSETGSAVRVAEDPVHAVVRGAAMLLERGAFETRTAATA